MAVHALLGPTNTGKTHRAIERMLSHRTGMIGLPLRLLAREVYDRVSAQLGQSQVALVTGEEKRVPPTARYWVCTVEAMPDHDVDFLAVDEIQLAANEERGHVFTERLLLARGRLETLFLGSDTIAPRMRELVPDVRIERLPRLSALRHRGRTGLGGLTARSAIVAFRSEDIYEIASRLRAKRGGAAVVLGALSPRARNAQVALFQERDVHYLVATDAIGMGLNLDIDHVAFSSIEKFDGKAFRLLANDELAQIAGRAGRHRKDGTFGTLNPCPSLPERVALALEEHRFAPKSRLVWRNSVLNFRSPEDLIASLTVTPPSPNLARVERADDFDALRKLANQEEVRRRAVSHERVLLLWEVCQIPDYRRLLLDRHTQLLQEIYVQLVDEGQLEPDWLHRHLTRLERFDGDVEQLTARLSEVRVWTYVSHRPNWTVDPLHWQERARETEDRISDALHARLVERFVEIGRKSVQIEPTTEGSLSALRTLWQAGEREKERQRSRYLEELIASGHDELELVDSTIRFRNEPVACLQPGSDLLSPRIQLEIADALGAKTRILARLSAYWRDCVERWLGPLRASPDDSPPMRGLLYQLERTLGTATRREVAPQLGALNKLELRDREIAMSPRAVWSIPMHGESSLRLRATLVRLHTGLMVPERAFAQRDSALSDTAYLSAGFIPVGRAVVRPEALSEADRALSEQRIKDAPAELLEVLGYRQTADGIWRKRPKPRRPR